MAWQGMSLLRRILPICTVGSQSDVKVLTQGESVNSSVFPSSITHPHPGVVGEGTALTLFTLHPFTCISNKENHPSLRGLSHQRMRMVAPDDMLACFWKDCLKSNFLARTKGTSMAKSRWRHMRCSGSPGIHQPLRSQ